MKEAREAELNLLQRRIGALIWYGILLSGAPAMFSVSSSVTLIDGKCGAEFNWVDCDVSGAYERYACLSIGGVKSDRLRISIHPSLAPHSNP